MSRKRSPLSPMLTLLVFVPALAGAASYFVDQKHPKAADTNPGTEDAPFKTIQKGANAAAAGDTVYVKAGIYRECVLIRKSGKYGGRTRQWHFGEAIPDRIVLSAWGDDKVIIDGSEPIPPKAWKPVEGREGVYAASVEPDSGGITIPQRGVHLLYWKGKRILQRQELGKPQAGETGGESDACFWWYDVQARKLYVCLAGADPSDELLFDEQGPVEASVRPCGVSARGQQFVTLRKLTIRRTGWRAIETAQVEPILEDCEVYDCEIGISAGVSLRPIIRRCVVHDVSCTAMDLGNSEGALVYDNVAYAFNQDWAGRNTVYQATAYTMFAGQFARFFNNIAAQPQDHMNKQTRGGSFWPDCRSPGHFFFGNACYRCASGFYIESPACGNILLWNTCLKMNSGIWLARNAMNLVAENYCADNASGLVLDGTDAALPDMAHNIFSHNWLRNNRNGLYVNPEPGGQVQTRNYAQRNVYEVPADGRVATWARVPYKTVAEFQKGAGQEAHGKEEKINPDELGMVWVRLDDLDISHEPFPMFGNPDCQRLNAMVDAYPYFWRPGDGSGTDGYPEEWQDVPGESIPYEVGGWPMASVTSPGGLVAWPTMAPVEGTPVGGMYLFVGSLKEGFSKKALGWWSPSLPAAGGSTVDVSLWMKTEEVKAAEPDGGVVVYVEWSGWTGQNKTRSYLVGGEEGVKPVRAELCEGTQPWTEVKGSVAAPKDARRLALFMGARSCTGKASFDEIRTFAARPGPPSKPAPAK